MKDGHYDLCLSADGYSGRGSLLLEGRRARGSDGHYRIQGNVFDAAQHINAVFSVLMPPALIANARVPEHYSLQMTGTADDAGFTLIGVGPLGLIVEIACSYKGPLSPDQHAGLVN
jgi:hypothetical protein